MPTKCLFNNISFLINKKCGFNVFLFYYELSIGQNLITSIKRTTVLRVFAYVLNIYFLPNVTECMK